MATPGRPSKSTPLANMQDSWFVQWGIKSWLFLGIVLALVTVSAFISASSTISTPLILSFVIGAVVYPIVAWMNERGVPKSAGATAVLVLLAVVIGGTVWLTIKGTIDQWGTIAEHLQAGIASLSATLASFGVDTAQLHDLAAQVQATDVNGVMSSLGGMLSSFGDALMSGLSGIFALGFGIFVSVVLLYYTLVDFPMMRDWIARHLGGLPEDVGVGIVEDSVDALRGYFKGTAITGIVVALTIGVAALLLGLPLVMSIVLVTFVSCFVPYLGAILSGAYAFLVAFGSGGLWPALTILAVVLIAQNALQTVVNAKVMGSSLNLHPLVILVVTILGSVFGGIMGATLAAPLTAIIVRAYARVSALRDTEPACGEIEATAEQV